MSGRKATKRSKKTPNKKPSLNAFILQLSDGITVVVERPEAVMQLDGFSIKRQHCRAHQNNYELTVRWCMAKDADYIGTTNCVSPAKVFSILPGKYKSRSVQSLVDELVGRSGGKCYALDRRKKP